MGERSIVEVADALNSGLLVRDITFIDGTVYKTRKKEDIYDAIFLPDYSELKADKRELCQKFLCAISKYRPVFGKAFSGKL